ncbi:bifunctional 2-polyprenyl-6-hydroxyphenol methylase/3-demethylubiquinol 3-O-methyltransferase UbiG [Jatrophihabitans endophyticus]|uniref:class I SAM-dependent methyltransferase n=1 Tax=Jatrophihabitans endophyticus TaxID=1206085 RepID=UPI0019E2C3EE|nr:class I SAM-dependent methyltransferase [Jatrophihabitans endophyticus]MBE7187382.1 class I SAM-dependent methyltransferase [Jatrophihabitans endophyticus]
MTSARVGDPDHRVAAGRGGLVSTLLAAALHDLAAEGRPVRVLDCGGGSGSFAVPLASEHCEVTVVDISADALATLRRRADEAGVATHVHAVNGDVEALSSLVQPASVDAVLAHGVLDAVDHVEPTLREMVTVLRPGGLLSVLVANPVASVVARALAGEPIAALTELRELGSESGALDPDQVEALCRGLGLVPAGERWRHGVGVFSDLVPGAALDTPGARDAVRALDAEAAGIASFAGLAGRVHLLFRRPAA